VRELRACGLSPKIAHSLGIRRAVASDLVRALGAERADVGEEDRNAFGYAVGVESDQLPLAG
jgi:hypothetical protein